MWFHKNNTKDTSSMFGDGVILSPSTDARLYLIAQAPSYIPRWFKPEIRQKLPKDQYERERTLQWPIYWTEQMLIRMGYVEEDGAQTNS